MNWLRGLMLCVSGMMAFGVFSCLALLFYPYFVDPAGKAGYGDFPTMDHSIPATIVSFASGFLIMMTAQKRIRTNPMAAWVLPALFVMGMAIGATVWWLAFLWADEIAAFLFLHRGAR